MERVDDMTQQIQNRTVFTRDNLEVMRGVDSESIDLIYLDPPFNSKHNYAAPIGSKAAGAAFKDTWTLSDIDIAWIKQLKTHHPRLAAFLDMVGKISSKSDQAYLTYMAPRLLEMHRLLKPTGSIYLHCDSTMSHSLKLVMGTIFGSKNFRNEIFWQRTDAHSDGKRYGKITDTILFYSKSDSYNWNNLYIPFTQEEIKDIFTHKDNEGAFTTSDLTAQNLSGGGYEYEFHGQTRIWKRPIESMKELESRGMIYIPKDGKGVPRYKRYLKDSKGKPLQNLWTDIHKASGAERTGYPTQKPLKLLERVIKASSNEGDIVLDPFAGCATTCVAAEMLGRQWIGIDISSKAVELVKERLRQRYHLGNDKNEALFGSIVERTDIPVRSDNIKRSKNIKELLYGMQGGRCNGCGTHFKPQNLTVDHIIAKSKGGQDTDSNLQLLCGSCNSIKGDRDMTYLVAEVDSRGYRN